MIDWTLSADEGWTLFHHFLVSDLPLSNSNASKPLREHIRQMAAREWPTDGSADGFWAFRLLVRRQFIGQHADLDNYIKPVVDAFAKQTLIRDHSDFANDLELYPDDDVGNVRMMEMAAEEGDQLELEVWIYHHLSG